MALNIANPLSLVETHKVIRIEFGILDPNEIIQSSAAKIDKERTQDYITGKPVEGGINDLRMGTVDRLFLCGSCGGNHQQCPGHFGHIELVKPLYHKGFLEEVIRVLRCVCHNCKKLLTDHHNLRFRAAMKIREPQKRGRAVLKICQSITECKTGEEEDKQGGISTKQQSHGGCGAKQPKYKRDGLTIIREMQREDMEEQSEDRKRPLRAEEALEVLKGISSEDCLAMGFDPDRSRPD